MSIDTTASFKWMSIDTNFYTYTYISLSSLKYTFFLEFSIIISNWENALGTCQQTFTNTFIFTLTYTYTFHLHFHIFSYTYTFHLHIHQQVILASPRVLHEFSLLAKIYDFCKYVRLWKSLLLAKIYDFCKYVRLWKSLLLAKIYDFCKYVRLWKSLFVCYLPKSTIFASMFVCRKVCLFVWILVCSAIQVAIFIRLTPNFAVTLIWYLIRGV